MKYITIVATVLLLAGCDNSTPSPETARIDASSAVPTETATREPIAQFRLWAKVFRGEDVASQGNSFSGRIDLDGEDVLIFDKSATGTLTYAYPVPVKRSIIVISPGGGMVIRCSPRTIPQRFLHAIPSMKAGFQAVNADSSLGRAPGESAGGWYARILTALADSMETAAR